MEKKPTPEERLVATLPLVEAKKEDQRLYGNASDYALLTFRNAMQEMLDLGWPVAHIAAQVLSFCDARLDPKLIDEIQAQLDIIADEEDEDEVQPSRIGFTSPHGCALGRERKAARDEMKAARSTNMVGSGYDTVDWSGCEEVERVEGKLSGVPILKHTRMQADLVLDNYQAGLSVEEIADTYDLKLQQVKAVIDYSLSH